MKIQSLIVYEDSMTISPDDIPVIKESEMLNQQGAGRGLEEKPEKQIEPLIDVTSGERFIQVVAEIQGVDKNAIKLNATEKILNFLYLRASEKYAAS